MRRALSFLIVVFLTAIRLSGQDPGSILLINGKVIDVRSGQVQENARILIEGSIIQAVGSEVEVPSSARVVDVKGKWIMPGLVDAHIHFFQSGGIYTRPDALDLRKYVPYEKEIQWMKDHLDDTFRRYLANGITTVIDAGGPMYNYAIRDSVAQLYLSPEVFITGPLVSTYQPEALRIDDPPIIEVHSNEEAFQVVDRQVPYQPDFIKIWYIARNFEEAQRN